MASKCSTDQHEWPEISREIWQFSLETNQGQA